MSVTVVPQSRTITYLLTGAVFLLLVGVVMTPYLRASENQRAEEKAMQLSTELTAAGLTAPATEPLARVLGDDGGGVCDDPGNALRRGVLHGMLTNGAAGPGLRPVIVDNDVVKGQLLIMKVYCPQYLGRFQEVVDDLKTADTVAG